MAKKKMTEAEALEVLKGMAASRRKNIELLEGIQCARPPSVRATRRNIQEQISALEMAIEALTPD